MYEKNRNRLWPVPVLFCLDLQAAVFRAFARACFKGIFGWSGHFSFAAAPPF